MKTPSLLVSTCLKISSFLTVWELFIKNYNLNKNGLLWNIWVISNTERFLVNNPLLNISKFYKISIFPKRSKLSLSKKKEVCCIDKWSIKLSAMLEKNTQKNKWKNINKKNFLLFNRNSISKMKISKLWVSSENTGTKWKDLNN